MIIPFELNGTMVYLDANPGERLVRILRQRFKLLDSKEGCLSGRCGSCMVQLDGNPVPSCIIPVFEVKHRSVRTIEGFRQTEDFADIRQGFDRARVTMCGFCDAGKILIADSILRLEPKPSDEFSRSMFSGNICRCTSVDDLVEGVRIAGAIRRKRLNAQ